MSRYPHGGADVRFTWAHKMERIETLLGRRPLEADEPARNIAFPAFGAEQDRRFPDGEWFHDILRVFGRIILGANA
jgi:hypothetical protein